MGIGVGVGVLGYERLKMRGGGLYIICYILRVGDWRLKNGYQEVWIEQNVKECPVLGTYYGCKIEKDG